MEMYRSIILQAILIEKCMNGRSADMVTIQDVAERTGVSIAAVFIHLNRIKPVGRETERSINGQLTTCSIHRIFSREA